MKIYTAILRSVGAVLAVLITPMPVDASPLSLRSSVDYFSPVDAVSIGDVGFNQSRKVSRWSPSLTGSWQVSRQLALDLGFRSTPRASFDKVSWNSPIFPSPIRFPVVTPYRLSQKSVSVYLGPTYTLPLWRRLELAVSIYGVHEWSTVNLEYSRGDFSRKPYRKDRDLNVGGRVGFNYSVNDRIVVHAQYSANQSSLKLSRYSGGGVGWRF